MKKSKEWKRGYRSAKKHYEETYRSFKIVNGELYGYTKTGSLRKFGPLSHWKDTKGFGAGWYTCLKEMIKKHPTKKIKHSKMVLKTKSSIPTFGKVFNEIWQE